MKQNVPKYARVLNMREYTLEKYLNMSENRYRYTGVYKYTAVFTILSNS